MRYLHSFKSRERSDTYIVRFITDDGGLMTYDLTKADAQRIYNRVMRTELSGYVYYIGRWRIDKRSRSFSIGCARITYKELREIEEKFKLKTNDNDIC